MSDDKKYLGVGEFRARGYLMELNRQFLHPLGLALETRVSGDGTDEFRLWDCRDDPEGLVFAELDADDLKRAMVIREERGKKFEARRAKYGWDIQPIPSTIPSEDSGT